MYVSIGALNNFLLCVYFSFYSIFAFLGEEGPEELLHAAAAQLRLQHDSGASSELSRHHHHHPSSASSLPLSRLSDNNESNWDLVTNFREPSADRSIGSGHRNHYYQIQQQQQQHTVGEQQLLSAASSAAAAVPFPLDSWEELEGLDLFPTSGPQDQLQQQHNDESSSYSQPHFQEHSPSPVRQRPDDVAAAAPVPQPMMMIEAMGSTPVVAAATRLHSVIQRGPRSSLAKVLPLPYQ
jgi:hypothetical protein